jgi:hypothetical protein
MFSFNLKLQNLDLKTFSLYYFPRRGSASYLQTRMFERILLLPLV